MTSAAPKLDPEFPNLRPEVAEGYRNAPSRMTLEVIDGELYTMTRPRMEHQSAGDELYGELRNPLRWAGAAPEAGVRTAGALGDFSWN